MPWRLGNRCAISLFLLAAGGLFTLDTTTRPGIGDGIGYSGVMVICLWMAHPRAPRVAAMALTLLVIIGGLVIEPDGRLGITSLVNRSLAIAAIWAVSFLLSYRKVLETELYATTEQAQSASVAKSQFLATMSHELRTPLNAILGFSEAMSRGHMGSAGVERYREYAEDIYRSAQHLLTIVDDILDLARVDAGQYKVSPGRLDVRTQVQQALDTMELVAANAGLRLACDVPADIPPVYADARLLQQILLNLLSNAVKFTGPGGTVEITARQGADRITLTVSDTGVGIPAEQLPLLGQPFRQVGDATRRGKEGTGLGLALAKAFTELQGGSLTIRSKLGEGTKVTLALRPAPNGG
jgi:signal transduction histidine kinase